VGLQYADGLELQFALQRERSSAQLVPRSVSALVRLSLPLNLNRNAPPLAGTAGIPARNERFSVKRKAAIAPKLAQSDQVSL
jgi:hypothetical protein